MFCLDGHKVSFAYQWPSPENVYLVSPNGTYVIEPQRNVEQQENRGIVGQLNQPQSDLPVERFNFSLISQIC